MCELDGLGEGVERDARRQAGCHRFLGTDARAEDQVLLRPEQPGEERPRDRPAVGGHETERDMRVGEVRVRRDQDEIAE